jgi:hypothetical protein
MKLLQTVIACTFLLIGSAAWATVYEWVDNQGIVHMTDDPDKVPARYRKVMKARDIDTGGSAAPAAEPKGAVPSSEAGLPEEPEVLLYGGRNVRWWLGTFREARENIEKHNAQIAGKKKKLEQLRRKRVLYQKPSDRVAYYALMDEIARDEEQVKVLQKNLDDLESQADKAGVPQHWR